MSKIILEDWEDYDNKKKKTEDRLFVSCEEQWERDYIGNKTLKYYPNLTVVNINNAVQKACENASTPRPRHKFRTFVCNQLGISLV